MLGLGRLVLVSMKWTIKFNNCIGHDKSRQRTPIFVSGGGPRAGKMQKLSLFGVLTHGPDIAVELVSQSPFL